MYIKHILKSHGWTKDSQTPPKEPLTPLAMMTLQDSKGPEDPDASGQLHNEAGFSYRKVLGETIYTSVVCWFDIIMGVSLLAHFAEHPTGIYYKALKRLWAYLRSTKDCGLIFW